MIKKIFLWPALKSDSILCFTLKGIHYPRLVFEEFNYGEDEKYNKAARTTRNFIAEIYLVNCLVGN